ncbi:alpha/beta hydrolase [Marihabitans asiaticum]|nr:alpha/beta hydrolase [Marihabitans asiaticum]
MRDRAGSMALRTAVLTRLVDRVRGSIETSTMEDLQRRRATVYPGVAPFTWLTGAIDPTVRRTEITVSARDGAAIPLRCYQPRSTGAMPLIVFIHGGGWVQGSTRMYDPICTRLAREVEAVVVSIDYRMAPEHLAPTAAEDCIDVVSALLDGPQAPALESVDVSRVALAGDSAGGNLAAVVAQQLRHRRGPDDRPSIRGQVLVYPAVDLTMASPSIEEFPDAPILTRDGIYTFRNLYLDGRFSTDGAPLDDPRGTDPLLSPIHCDATEVAPALVQVAELDPLRDDGLRYAEHLRASGVNARITQYRRLPHGYLSMPGACPGADSAIEEIVAFLRQVLG